MVAQIHPDLMARLESISKRENRSVDAVLEMLLNDYTDLQEDTLPSSGTLAQFAASAKRHTFHSGFTDTADRSREILQNEWGAYLVGRMNNGEKR